MRAPASSTSPAPATAPLHWREYAIEGWALGVFMVSACTFGTLLFHPESPLSQSFGDWSRRAVMGVIMGLTLIALAYSPWGKRSGAQMNPAFTLAFFRLGRIAPVDAAAYIVAQFIGGALGVWLSSRALGMALGHPEVHYVVTRPGAAGTLAALAGEFVISALQLTLVLHLASSRWKEYTAIGAAVALASYITLESPLSGMSMNPARTVASALVAGDFTALWVYFVGPIAGMLAAATLFAHRRERDTLPCGKLVHGQPCLFCDHVAGTGNPSPRPVITAAQTAP